MSTALDNDRLQAAQALIERIARDYGVSIVVTNTVKRVDDGSVIVTPAISLQLIEGWQATNKTP